MPGGSGFIIATILVNGQPMAAAFALAGIDVTRTVNRIPVALLTIQAPGAVTGEATLMAGGPFKVAAEVEIKVREADSEDVGVFKGVVTALGIHTRDGAPTLEVTIKDKAVRLAGRRQSRVWTDMSDSDAIRAIVQDAGITLGDAPDTAPRHQVLVQHEASDWDFILSRADALGLLVVVQDGTLSLSPMNPIGLAANSVTFGLDAINDVHFELDATTQAQGLTSLVWDPAQLAAASPVEAKVLSLPQGGIGTSVVGSALGLGSAHLTHMVPLPSDEAQAWATSRMARARLALIRGRISTPGNANAMLMEVTKLAGFGQQFSGEALITGLRHRLDAHGFSTDLQFGLTAEPVGRLADMADMAAGGLLPSIPGVQIGIVTDNADPETMGRVKVSVPAIATEIAVSLWARVVSPDAGPGSGFCFLPEVGDEVLVAFLGSDPRYPVVLGRLHGSKNTLPGGFEDAKQKGIVTTKGVRIVFSEADKPAITISTPDGRTVVLDDDKKTITLSDKNNNIITLDADGITVNSGKDLTLKASGAVKVSGASIDLN